MTDRTTRCDGIDIRFRVEGDGEPVTLVHGVGSNLESWDRVAVRLVPEFKVIRLDLRGLGRSGPVAGELSLEDYVADVIAVLDAAAIRRTDLVGSSLGGMIAQCVAITHPERVRRLALFSAVAGRTAAERRALRDRADKIRDRGIASVAEAAAARWFTDGFRRAHPDKVRARLQLLLANDHGQYAKAYKVFAESDMGARIHEIRHRTLIVTGEHDVGSNPRMARFMHRQIGESRLVILPGLKHGLLFEVPDTVADLLLAFLRA